MPRKGRIVFQEHPVYLIHLHNNSRRIGNGFPIKFLTLLNFPLITRCFFYIKKNHRVSIEEVSCRNSRSGVTSNLKGVENIPNCISQLQL
ncbi:hypothetical protein NC651_027924 [Populus alba x Populus x berolinensis]|nr:hypothetical protein NC651_027924 [Populus alba x Populus x berolinensis]